jgi:putative CocE/NonD family hydrolase
MRDGVKIAMDLHLPKGLKEGAKIPTVLFQTRYVRSIEYRWPFSLFMDKEMESGDTIEMFVLHGYAWVQVDARGSGASFGSRPFPWSPDEVKDGAEIVDWIIRQPWSDGEVGALGWSYTGTTSEFLLVNNHPAVKAVAPRFALFDTYTDIAYPGGIHISWFTETWARFNSISDRNAIGELGLLPRILVKGPTPVDEDKDRSMLTAASRDHEGNYDVHEQALGITYRDDISPSGLGTTDTFSPHAYLDKLNSSGAAVYSFSGWFDGAYQHAAIKRFMALEIPCKLTIGPWDHSIEINPWWPDAMTPEFDFDAEMLRFFDYHLKGIDNGVMDEPLVHYYTMVEEVWKTAGSWPPTSAPKIFYFAPGNGLSPQKADEPEGADEYVVDYTTGTDLKSRWVSLVNVEGETIEYRGWDRKNEKLLCYTSAPLDEDTEVTGHPIVTLYVTSTADDGNFFVYLEDVDPDGHAAYVTEGQLRAIHRRLSDKEPPYPHVVPYRSFTKKDAAPLKTGEVAELVFDLLPTSYLFKKDHSIRVAVAGADKDHFALMKTDPPPILKVQRNMQYPSAIELPVVVR